MLAAFPLGGFVGSAGVGKRRAMDGLGGSQEKRRAASGPRQDLPTITASETR